MNDGGLVIANGKYDHFISIFLFSSFKFSLILWNVRVWAIFVIVANVSFFPFFTSTIACLRFNYVHVGYDGNFPSFSSLSFYTGIWGLSTWEFQMKKINLIFAVVVIYLTSFSVVSLRRNFFREDIWALAFPHFSRILFNK